MNAGSEQHRLSVDALLLHWLGTFRVIFTLHKQAFSGICTMHRIKDRIWVRGAEAAQAWEEYFLHSPSLSRWLKRPCCSVHSAESSTALLGFEISSRGYVTPAFCSALYHESTVVQEAKRSHRWIWAFLWKQNVLDSGSRICVLEKNTKSWKHKPAHAQNHRNLYSCFAFIRVIIVS